MKKTFVIGDYSIVNEHVSIGNKSGIWHFCNIYGTKDNPVIIGSHTQVGSYTEIKPGVKIGDYCRLQSYVFLPEGVTVRNYVFIGPRAVFTNDKHPDVIKTINQTWELKSIVVMEYASIGANATIGPGVTIGSCSIIGSCANVTKDVPDYAIAIGNPARVIGHISDKKFRKHYKSLLLQIPSLEEKIK